MEVGPPGCTDGRNVKFERDESIKTTKCFNLRRLEFMDIMFHYQNLSIFTPIGGSETFSWISELWLIYSTFFSQFRYLQTLESCLQVSEECYRSQSFLMHLVSIFPP